MELSLDLAARNVINFIGEREREIERESERKKERGQQKYLKDS